MTETVASLLAGHRSGQITVADTVSRTFRRLRDAGDPAIFISVRDEAAVQDEARALSSLDPATSPLYGIPVAVKDNIDVAGLATTAACPAYAYAPQADAEAVARLRRAGALIIGKTNLDQFATGLVGMRSPYGMPRNPLRADLVSGGSSSGSAVAVARGIVPLALGTDTAGSGRIPAGLNNIVGLKPSLGLVPTTGVVPACRSLDCVSVFALTAEDAFAALSVMAGHDENDAFSRPLPLGALSAIPAAQRIAIPRPADRIHFGDRQSEAAFTTAIEIMRGLGATLVEIDLTPFFEAARLLYEGPWVAERTAAVGDFMAQQPDSVHPVTRSIISQGVSKSAVDTFRAFYKLAALRKIAARLFADCDALMVPTMPRPRTIAELEADPIGPNSELGTYTNFVNLLDLAGIAVPAARAADGTAYGITLLAPSGRDAFLASLGGAFHACTGLTLGALAAPLPPWTAPSNALAGTEAAIAVVGAHLSGMPLNHELTTLGARFIGLAETTADYRLFALNGSQPPKPGLLRVAAGSGAPIAVEIWALPVQSFGRFVAGIPAPLSIGSLRLSDGRAVKGFLVEAEAVRGARDISSFGGWRAFMAACTGA
ncbi:MAG: allophanate hydrolase [Hyphomicrobiaceae bacterium]